MPNVIGEPWEPARHLTYLTTKLLDLEQRRIRRIIIESAPRHGKSSLCTVAFTAWYLGRHPTHRVMIASEEAGLATEFSEKARNILQAWGPEIFGVSVHGRRTRASDWRLANHTGRVMAAGIKTGGLTGRGANLLIIDDAIRSPESALSEVYREKVWNWYLSTARTRLEPNGVVLVTMTRWHEDDLVGRLVKKEGHLWERVTLPAVAVPPNKANGWKSDPLGREVGEALWPERMPRSALDEIAATNTYWWNAMYQQAPTPEGGTLAKAAWFKIVDDVPRNSDRVRFWDCAATEDVKEDPDWTVGALLARCRETKRIYIEDIIRFRAEPGDVDARIKRQARIDGKTVMVCEEQEPGSAGKTVTAMRLRELAGWIYKGVKNQSAKPVRWMPFLVQAHGGNVFMKKADWNDVFLDEAVAAPYGAKDDQLDATAGAFIELVGGVGAIRGAVW